MRLQSEKTSNPSLANSSPTLKRRYTKPDIMDKGEKEPLKKDESKLVQAEAVETGKVREFIEENNFITFDDDKNY